MRRVWTFIVGLSVVLTIVTGSVTVGGYLAYPERRVETVLTDSVTTIGWLACLGIIALVALYFLVGLLDEFADEPFLAFVTFLVGAGLYYVGHLYLGFGLPDIDKPPKAALEKIGWFTVGYVGLLLVGGLVTLIGYLTRAATCAACGGRVPRKANFCPSCGRALPADQNHRNTELESQSSR